jgi:hypothetical protein
MATASFDPLQFLMRIRPHLLSQYAVHHHITYVTKQTEAGETAADELVKTVQKHSEEAQSGFFVDIGDIDDVATGTGCDYLVNRATALGYNLNTEEYKELENGKERAMYFYLNWPELFSETYDQYNIDNLGGWRSELTIAKSIEEILKNIPDFKNALSSLYKKECKGNKLKIRHVQKEDRVVFTAYIEDAFTNSLEFDKKTDDLNSKKAMRPVFTAYFSYRQKEGTLDVKAQGGKPRIQQLQKIFIAEMLKEEPVLKNAARYDFARLQHLETLTFPFDVKDAVESVTLCGLRLIDNATKTIYHIDIGNVTGAGTQPMIDTLKARHINLKDYHITQFKLEVVFDNHGEGRKRKVTTAISSPNICDLKYRPIDVVVRQLLKRWKLDLFP